MVGLSEFETICFLLKFSRLIDILTMAKCDSNFSLKEPNYGMSNDQNKKFDQIIIVGEQNLGPCDGLRYNVSSIIRPRRGIIGNPRN